MELNRIGAQPMSTACLDGTLRVDGGMIPLERGLIKHRIVVRMKGKASADKTRNSLDKRESTGATNIEKG